MFINVKTAARFAPERPMTQLISENDDSRIVVFGFEPGQAVSLHTSSSTVLMHVVEGSGTLQVGSEVRSVSVGDLAVCQPDVPHALAASPGERMVVLAIIAPRP